jgi:hypothetical protein
MISRATALGKKISTLSARMMPVGAVVAVLMALMLFAVRISSALSFSEPLQLTTSGAEWESLFAVWKSINGQQVYTDRLAIPFNAVVYNWLFYFSYGNFTQFFLDALSLTDHWLPTVARFLTLLGCAVGIAGAHGALGQALPRGDTDVRVFLFCLSIYLMLGPLVGWWAFTVRSDVWAMALEICAVALFMRLRPAAPLLAVTAFALLAYGAWSFKQINITTICAVGLFLLCRRRLKEASLLAALLVTAWALTLIAGGKAYIDTILFADFTILFDASRGVWNLTNFLYKTTPVAGLALAGLISLAVTAKGYRRLWDDDILLLASLGIAFGLLVPGAASFQTGAAENYFFTFSFFLSLFGARGTFLFSAEAAPLPPTIAIPALVGCVLGAVAVLFPLTGRAGVIDLSDQHDRYARWAECVSDLPRPIFSDDSYLGLPWITPGNIPFVVSFQYKVERTAWKRFEAGGIGGLIAANRIKTLLFHRPLKNHSSYDGAVLTDYLSVETPCKDITVMVHKDENTRN